jgi:CBS domain containing-hemolysin-like protein
MLVAGLVWGIPTPGPHTDPHGYLAIFSLLGSLALMVLAIVVAGSAALLLQSSRRWGGVLLAIAAALACLESLGLATGFPTGIGDLAPVRIATIAVGVLWFAISAASLVLGVLAFRAIPPRRAPGRR